MSQPVPQSASQSTPTPALEKQIVVLYHGNCPDGFGSAFAAWLVLGDTADSFAAWQEVLEMPPTRHNAFVNKGAAIDQKFLALCEDVAAGAIEVSLLGHKGLIVNAPYAFSSEVGSALAHKSGTFGMVWMLESPTDVKVSLRSHAPFEVEPLARALGGGGHARASAYDWTWLCCRHSGTGMPGLTPAP